MDLKILFSFIVKLNLSFLVNFDKNLLHKFTDY